MAIVRPGVLLLFVCLCRAQVPGPAAEGKGRVAGQVVHVTAGTPLRKVQLRLKRFGADGGVMSSPSVSNYATTTNAEGRFSFDGVDPGVYWLWAERPGYLEQSYGAREPLLKGSPVKLSAGQRREDLVIKLTPQSFLYGKVGDEDGDLIANAQVLLYRASWAKGRKRFQVVGTTNSQDDGSFVIGNLGPGRYYLSAAPARRDDDPFGESKQHETYTTTYYPGAPDAGGASPVELGAGADVRGLEIRLRLARAFRIHGKAINTATGAPAVQAYLKLTARDAAVEPGHVEIGATTASDGTFEFKNVSPGDYIIAAGMTLSFVSVGSFEVLLSGGSTVEIKPPASPLIGRIAVHIGEQDVDNVIVPLGEGAQVTGAIRILGSDPSKPSPWPSLGLVPSSGLNEEAVPAQMAADGTFRMQHLVPDRYAIQMDGLPPGMYVKSVHFDGREVAGDNLDLSSGGVLEIALSPGGAAIGGIVRGPDGEPAAGATVQVTSADDTVRFTGAGENGEYKFDSLPPGDYRVLAWEEVEPGLSQDAAFRARFEAQSASVKLAEQGRSTADLKVITREAIEAEAAKLK